MASPAPPSHGLRQVWPEDGVFLHRDEALPPRRFLPRDSAREDARTLSEAEHPVVRAHPGTGRKPLSVHTSRLAGMTEEESASLPGLLSGNQVQPDLACRLPTATGRHAP